MAKKTDSAPLHSQISVLINAKQLSGLLKDNRSISKQTAELTGSLREKIAYSKEKHGLHTGAFAVLKRLDRMEPEAALEFMTHLEAYLDLSGVKKKMESVVRMNLEGESDVGGEAVDLAEHRKRRKSSDEFAAAAAE
jgi:hypothetical protein